MKLVPRHVSVGDKLHYTVPKAAACRPKGTHVSEKYNPRSYLRRPRTTNAGSRLNVAEPLFYEYRIRVRVPASAHCSRKSQKGNNEELDADFGIAKETDNELYSSAIKSPEHQSVSANYYKDLPKTAMCAKVGFNFPRAESPATQYRDKLSKEKYRRKWEKLSKRTLFNFEVDMDSNSVSLVRVKKPGVEDETQSKVRAKVKLEGPSLSPHLQRKKGVEDRPRKNSIKVYYGLGSESPSKAVGLIEAAEEKSSKKQIFKSLLTSNMKTSLRLKEFLQKGPMETAFDLNSIKLEDIEPSSYFHLYLAIRKSVAPTFFDIPNKQINQLDPEVVEALTANPPKNIELTKYDEEVVGEYKRWVEAAREGKVMTGFWKVRRVYGCRPTCRESPTVACFQGKFYFFGGYGVDRMNDLWCLSMQDEELGTGGCNWTAIHPLGSRVPAKRYGHCMAVNGNNIYAFGGSSEFIAGLKMRTVLNDIWKYSVEENRWDELEAAAANGASRMYAASCVFGDLWFVHGGNSGCPGNPLSSAVVYSFGSSPLTS